MGSFKFRLETLLKVRRTARDERRASLAEAYEAERLLIEQAEQLGSELNEVRECIRQASQPGEINVDQLMATHRHEVTLNTQRSELAGHAEQLGEEIEKRRNLLVAADRQVQVLEKLRDRQEAAHIDEELKKEIKELDEIATLRFGDSKTSEV